MSGNPKRRRMSLASIRQNYRNIELMSKVPDRQKAAALQVLEDSGKHPEIVARVNGCSQRYPCNSKWCPKCSNPRTCSRGRALHGDQFLTPGQSNLTTTATGSLASNYRVRSAQKKAMPFDQINLILLHIITINLGMVSIDGDLSSSVKWYRKRIKRALRRLSKGAIVRGKFDMVLKYVDQLQFEIHAIDLPEELQNRDMPHQRYGMLHVHLVVFDPWLSRDDLRDILVEEFPGKKRVRVSPPYEDAIHPSGGVTGGVQGYLEYASMEKVELGFGSESVDATLEFAQLDATWSRANRNFSMGTRTKDTMTSIDPVRVHELEGLQREKLLLRTFKTLSFAERWLHIWMSNAKQFLAEVRVVTSASKCWTKWLGALGKFTCLTCNSSQAYLRKTREKVGRLLSLLNESLGSGLSRPRI